MEWLGGPAPGMGRFWKAFGKLARAGDRSPAVAAALTILTSMKSTRRRYNGQLNLYGTTEAAEYLGITRRNLTRLLAEKKVVRPVTRLACGPIWSESQLAEQRLLWQNGGPTRLDELRVRQMTLARRLGVLDRRWDALVHAAAEGDQRHIVAVWEGPAARTRHKQGRSALATRTEARHALAEAKLLHLVADLADQDEVFRGILDELDEAANLRKELAKVKKARSYGGADLRLWRA
jgi:hypothetical protein